MLPGVDERSGRLTERVNKVSPMLQGDCVCVTSIYVQRVISQSCKNSLGRPSAFSVQCLESTYSSSSSLLSLLLQAFPQVQHSRSTRQNKEDWVGRDVAVEGSDEEKNGEGTSWEGEEEEVEARREG